MSDHVLCIVFGCVMLAGMICFAYEYLAFLSFAQREFERFRKREDELRGSVELSLERDRHLEFAQHKHDLEIAEHAANLECVRLSEKSDCENALTNAVVAAAIQTLQQTTEIALDVVRDLLERNLDFEIEDPDACMLGSPTLQDD